MTAHKNDSQTVCWHGYGMDRLCPVCDMVEIAMREEAWPGGDG